METREASRPVANLIPPDWRSYPELVPVLKILVEGAKRVVLASRPRQPEDAPS